MIKAGFVTVRSGATVNVLEPSPGSYDLGDIAHSLSQQCRYNGHCPEHYSVAQHSCWVHQVVKDAGYDTNVQIAALLHDASEAYLGDVISPIKTLLPDYIVMERALQAAIIEQYTDSVTPGQEYAIDVADKTVQLLEARFFFPDAEWVSTGPSTWNGECWDAETSRLRFLDIADELLTESSYGRA